MIDFLEPNRLEKVLGAVQRFVLDGRRVTRVTAGVTALVVASCMLEAVRVHAAWQNSARWETQRERWSATLVELNEKARTQSTREAAVAALLRLRSKSVLQAANLARLGNAIAPRVGLVSLRHATDGVEVEGRARSVDDVAVTVGRLERLERPRKTTFALKRDDSVNGYVWFRIGLQQ